MRDLGGQGNDEAMLPDMLPPCNLFTVDIMGKRIFGGGTEVHFAGVRGNLRPRDSLRESTKVLV